MGPACKKVAACQAREAVWCSQAQRWEPKAQALGSVGRRLKQAGLELERPITDGSEASPDQPLICSPVRV